MKLYITKGIREILDLDKIPTTYEIVSELNDEVEVYLGSAYLIANHYQELKNLKYILLTTAGYNQLDPDYLLSRGITLTNARGIYSIPISESVVAHILYVNRGIKTYQSQQENKEWITYTTFNELTDAKVGFLGAGSIAEEILKRLKPFGIKASVWRAQNQTGPFDCVYTKKEGLQQLISESDYIINTLPLNDETANIISLQMVKLMKEEAFYINVGRAGTHDEKAILDALTNDKIRAAYLDVFNEEPIPMNSPIWNIPNLYITPHNSPSSTKNDERLNYLIIQNLNRYLKNEPLINVIV